MLSEAVPFSWTTSPSLTVWAGPASTVGREFPQTTNCMSLVEDNPCWSVALSVRIKVVLPSPDTSGPVTVGLRMVWLSNATLGVAGDVCVQL